jgi:bifunctional NMN adenylyltransferase/nudix hydrolase
MVIKKVLDECSRMIVFLGVAPTKCTREDPLPFQARRAMLEEAYPGIQVLYIRDMQSDKEWSRVLDEQIEDHTSPNHKIMLYGSRDSFIACYHGKHETTSIDDDGFKIYSGTAVRHQASIGVVNSQDWRKGAIWASQNTYQSVYPTVDVAIFNEDGTKVLLGRKPKEKKLRFPGGFVTRFQDEFVVGALEANARREVREECGDIEITGIEYVGSCQVNDWRYGSSLRIITTLFKAKMCHGRPQAGDDLEYLEWVEFDNIVLENVVVDTHQPLVRMLWEDRNRAKTRKE